MDNKSAATFSLLPVSKVCIRTRLPESEVFRRLNNALLPAYQSEQKGYTASGDKQDFIGEVVPPEFRIHQVVGHRQNSFIPLLIGTVRRDGEGTLITVRMRLNGCVIAFVLIWSYVPLLMLFNSLFFGIRDGNLEPSVPLAALGFLAFMYLIMTLGFRQGAKAARLFLVQTFAGEIV